MSGQSPPSEHDQLGWLMGEVDRLRAACLSDALDAGKSRLRVTELEAELEQARSTCPHSNCDAQRYRDALERIAYEGCEANWAWMVKIARDALAGDQQEGWFGSPR